MSAMKDRRELRGEWWLPDRPDRWPGTLVCGSAEGIDLTITSQHQDIPTGERFPIFYGETVDGKAVTLLDAGTAHTTMHMPGGTEARLRPATAVIGIWLDDADDQAFDRFVLQLDGLPEWANRSGFSLADSSNTTFSVEYALPAEIEVGAWNGFQVFLTFSATRKPSGLPTTAIELSQKTALEIRATEARSFREFDECARLIRDFLMFATRDRVALLSVEGFAEVDSTKSRSIEVLDRREMRMEQRLREATVDRLLFSVDENGVGTASRLTAWLELHELLGPIFDLFLVVHYQPKLFLELQFMSLAQAAESLHSRRFDAKTMPTGEHSQRVKEVVDAVPERLEDWVRERLASSNRKSFRQAIIELTQSLPDVVQAEIPDIRRVAERVRVTRNYLTHWDPKLKEKAAQGSELVALAYGLRCVVEARLMIEIGYGRDEAGRLLADNPDYMADLRFGFQ